MHLIRVNLALLFTGIVAAMHVACQHPQVRPPAQSALDFNAPLPPGQLALRKVDPSQYPDFSVSAQDLADFDSALANSQKYLTAPSSQQFFPYLDITHDRALATCIALRQDLAEPATNFNAIVIRDFEVYKSIGAPDPDKGGFTDRVLFTGYCTPIYEASLSRTAEFQYPLYKRPADLETDATGNTASRKMPDGTSTPYYTRRQIEEGALAGQELVWLKDRFDAYVITVQGSARLHLADGSTLEIGYAGTNGYPYTAVALKMIQAGAISRDQLSLRSMRTYFDSHPGAYEQYIYLNDRYIFFTERRGGPFGCLNVPITAMRTLATDKSVYPRAIPAFLVAPVAGSAGTSENWRGFMVDQDAGGGIRTSGHCDIYFGIGPGAEEMSGRQYTQGALYYLALKPELVAKYLPAR